MSKGEPEVLSLLYIAGAGRSGTTLFSLLLGQSADCFAAGEVTHLWKRGVLEDELCGCGQTFSKCEFWQEVLWDAFGGLSRSEALEIERQRQMCCGLWTIPQWLLQGLPQQRLSRALAFYEPRLLQLYRSIRKISGKRILVDSSKFPPESLLLEKSEAIDLRLVHVVRNCKAVVYAWQKKKRRPAVYWRPDYMRVYHPLLTCSAWLVFNTLFEVQGRRLGRAFKQVRYEDLVDSVQAMSEDLSESLNIQGPKKSCLENNSLSSTFNHMVSGNPVRFEKAPLALTLDRQWEIGLPKSQSILIDILAGGAQRRYGY